jgi:MFS family permease
MLLIIIILLVPILSINGIYSGNIADMVGGLGTMSETITLAVNASTIGMAAVFPFVLPAKRHFRSKELLLGSLLVMALLSFICGITEEPVIIVICSFFIGFFKMFGMFELIMPIMFMLSPTGDRARFYSIFYPLSIGIGQASSYFTTQFAYDVQWQQVYIIATVVLLFCALLCIIFMHNLRPGKQVSLKGFDWLSVVLFSAALMLLNYALVFARQQAWIASNSILLTFAGFVLLFVLFLIRQGIVKAPNLALSSFKKKNVVHGLALTMLLGMYMATSTVQSTFITGVLGYSPTTNAMLNLAIVPGIVLAGAAGFHWFKNKWGLKGYIWMGFLAYAAYTVMMYFLMAPVIDIESLIIPSFLRGLGMGILFIGIGLYTFDKLEMMDLLSVAPIQMAIRSFLATAFFGAIYSWSLYKLQWQQVGDLAVNIDALNPFAVARGGGLSLYGPLQIQAILAASKSLLGYIIIASLSVLVYVSLHRFGKMHYRRVLLVSKKMAGVSARAYLRNSKEIEKEEVADIVSGAV